jgi:hypothetical protein
MLIMRCRYSSLEHFGDMCADPECEYSFGVTGCKLTSGSADQKANLELRLPALRDTCILMTSEVDLSWHISGSSKWEGGNRVERLQRLARRESIG